MTRWFDSESGLSYDTPQAYLDDAARYDDVREGCNFSLRDTQTQELKRFKMVKGKAVGPLPH